MTELLTQIRDYQIGLLEFQQKQLADMNALVERIYTVLDEAHAGREKEREHAERGKA